MSGIAHDAKVVELCERAQDALPESISWVWHDCYDSYDPWGSAMTNAFALNDLAHVHGWDTDPTYHASPFGADTDDSHYQMYADTNPTREDVETAIRVFSILLHGLELLGCNY